MNQNEYRRLVNIGYLALCGIFPFFVPQHFGELYHHGVKGQKWGVRNGPPYPIDRNNLDKRKRTDKIVMDALESGLVMDGVNREKQLRHTKDGRSGTRSYIDGDVEFAKELYEELKGTGEALTDKNGNWQHKEQVIANKLVGIHSDPETGKSKHTNKLTIVYSKTGSHLYPRKDDD